MPFTLRNEIIKLAWEDPKIRPFLLPMIKKGSFSSEYGEESFPKPRAKKDHLLDDYLEKNNKPLKKKDGTTVSLETVLKNPDHEFYDREYAKFGKWRKERIENLKDEGIDLTGGPYHEENKKIAAVYDGAVPPHRLALENHYRKQNIEKYLALREKETEEKETEEDPTTQNAVRNMKEAGKTGIKGLGHILHSGVKFLAGAMKGVGWLARLGKRRPLTSGKSWCAGLVSGGIVGAAVGFGLTALMGPLGIPLMNVIAAGAIAGTAQMVTTLAGGRTKTRKASLTYIKYGTDDVAIKKPSDFVAQLTEVTEKAKQALDSLQKEADVEGQKNIEVIKDKLEESSKKAAETNHFFDVLIKKTRDKKAVSNDNLMVAVLEEILKQLPEIQKTLAPDHDTVTHIFDLEDHLDTVKATLSPQYSMHTSNFGADPAVHHQKVLRHAGDQLLQIQMHILKSNAENYEHSISQKLDALIDGVDESQKASLEEIKKSVKALLPEPEPFNPDTGITQAEAHSVMQAVGEGFSGVSPGGMVYKLTARMLKAQTEGEKKGKAKKDKREQAVSELTEVTSFLSPREIDLARRYTKKDGSFDEEGHQKALDREYDYFAHSAKRVKEVVAKAQAHMAKEDKKEEEENAGIEVPAGVLGPEEPEELEALEEPEEVEVSEAEEPEAGKMASLRSRTIKLAYREPALRPYLLPLLLGEKKHA